MKSTKSLTENFIYNILYQVLVTALPVLTTPYIARVLGLHANGIHSYTEGMVTYFMLLGAVGTSLYGTRKIAYERGNKGEMEKSTWEIVLLRLILMVITLVIYIPLLCINNEFSYIYRIQIINIIANGIDISWFFQGVEDFKRITLRNLLVKFIYVVCLFVFIKTPEDLPLYVGLIVSSAVFGNLIMWLYLKEYIGNKAIMSKLRPFSHLKGSVFLFLPQITNYVYALMDRTMLKWITHNTDYVGIYDQAQRLIRAVTAVLQSVGYVMLARLSHLKAVDDEAGIQEYIHKSINFNLFWALPIMFGVLGTANDFIPLFLGKEYIAVIPVLKLLSPLVVTMSLNSVMGVQLLIAIGKEKDYAVATTTGAMVNIIVNMFLLRGMNVVGACISSLLAEVSVFTICFVKSRQYLKLRKILKDNLWVILGSILMYGLVILMRKTIDTNAFLKLGIEMVVASATYFAIMLISKNEILNLIILKIPNRFRINKR